MILYLPIRTVAQLGARSATHNLKVVTDITGQAHTQQVECLENTNRPLHGIYVTIGIGFLMYNTKTFPSDMSNLHDVPETGSLIHIVCFM